MATEYDDLGRLQLCKLCKERGLDYKSKARDITALRQLLAENDQGGLTALVNATTAPPPPQHQATMRKKGTGGALPEEPENEYNLTADLPATSSSSC